jgi:transcriptional regulator with XRE-family HTH domain
MQSARKGYVSDRSQELLTQLGQNIELARVRRRLKASTICSRAGISNQTYQRLKKGEAGISLGVLMNVLSALDLEEAMATIAAPHLDEVGMTLELAREPERVRTEGEGGNVQLEPDW